MTRPVSLLDEVTSPPPPPLVSSVSRFGSYVGSKFQPGSIKGSVLTMLPSMIGGGTLSIPFFMKQLGLGAGIIALVLIAFMANMCVRMLILCTSAANTYSYREMALKAFGQRFATFTVMIILLNLWGSCIAYMVVVKSIIPLALSILITDTENWFNAMGSALILSALVVFVVVPLSLMRDMRALRHSSLVSLCCFAYLVIVTIVKYFSYCGQSFEGSPTCLNSPALWSEIDIWKFDLSGALSVLPIPLCAFACHPSAIPVYKDLQRPCPRRIHKVTNRAVYISTAIYLLTGIFGYLTFGRGVYGNFLLNKYHHDTSVVIGAIGLGLALVVSIPVMIFTARLSIEDILRRSSSSGATALDRPISMSTKLEKEPGISEFPSAFNHIVEDTAPTSYGSMEVESQGSINKEYPVRNGASVLKLLQKSDRGLAKERGDSLKYPLLDQGGDKASNVLDNEKEDLYRERGRSLDEEEWNGRTSSAHGAKCHNQITFADLSSTKYFDEYPSRESVPGSPPQMDFDKQRSPADELCLPGETLGALADGACALADTRSVHSGAESCGDVLSSERQKTLREPRMSFTFSQARSTIDDDTADGAHETVNERRHRVKSTMISLIFIGSALGVAIPVDNLETVLGLLGASTTSLVCFVMPALFMYRLAPDHTPYYRWMKRGAACIGVLLSVLGVSAVVSILSRV